jgi:hypothetical protein
MVLVRRHAILFGIGGAGAAAGPNERHAPQDDMHKARRKRAKVSKPADFAGAGWLQFEYGYDGGFRVPDTDKDQTGPASVFFNATEDFQFQFDFDTFHSQTNNFHQRASGIGDAYVGAQFTGLPETQRRPALGFAYVGKFPTASVSKGLGTGRVDHKFTFLTSKKVRTTEIDLNASLLVNGKPGTHGRDSGYQLAFGFSHDLKRSLSLQGEIFGETLDTDQPRGLFAQGGLTYQPTTRASIDFGVRAGLNSAAPRLGLFAGVSYNLTNLYGRR